MNLTVMELFNNMEDEDFILLHEMDKLETFCYALTLDMNVKPDEKNNTYTA